MADSPAKKSAVVPGASIDSSLKIASCRWVIAAVISGEVKPHFSPLVSHASAPQPFQKDARYFHCLKSKSRMTMPVLPVLSWTAAPTSPTWSQFHLPCSISFAGSGCPAFLSRSLLTNTPNGEVENG